MSCAACWAPTDAAARSSTISRSASALLRQAGALLVEIHGQFDTQGLLDAVTHRALLDDYAGADTAKTVTAWENFRTAETALATAQNDAKRAQAEEDYLRGAVEDLDELDPKAGEEEKLAALRTRLMRRTQDAGKSCHGA